MYFFHYKFKHLIFVETHKETLTIKESMITNRHKPTPNAGIRCSPHFATGLYAKQVDKRIPRTDPRGPPHHLNTTRPHPLLYLSLFLSLTHAHVHSHAHVCTQPEISPVFPLVAWGLYARAHLKSVNRTPAGCCSLSSQYFPTASERDHHQVQARAAEPARPRFPFYTLVRVAGSSAGIKDIEWRNGGEGNDRRNALWCELPREIRG